MWSSALLVPQAQGCRSKIPKAKQGLGEASKSAERRSAFHHHATPQATSTWRVCKNKTTPLPNSSPLLTTPYLHTSLGLSHTPTWHIGFLVSIIVRFFTRCPTPLSAFPVTPKPSDSLQSTPQSILTRLSAQKKEKESDRKCVNSQRYYNLRKSANNFQSLRQLNPADNRRVSVFTLTFQLSNSASPSFLFLDEVGQAQASANTLCPDFHNHLSPLKRAFLSSGGH